MRLNPGSRKHCDKHGLSAITADFLGDLCDKAFNRRARGEKQIGFYNPSHVFG
jgi:hypothetical protein